MVRVFKMLSLCFLLSVVALTASVWQVSVPADAQPNAPAVPIIMYHSVIKNTAKSGPYVVTPDTVRSDLQFLKDRGYTSMFVSELVDLVNRSEPLPEKPVIITFDDGHLNFLTYVVEILEELEMKAVMSVVGKYTEEFSESGDRNPAYAHLTWQDIDLLRATGVVEIANHSYNMHNQVPRHGSKMIKGESIEHYRTALIDDTTRLQQLLKDNNGFEPTTYTYPFGQISKEALPILKELGFDSVLTCAEKVNYITDKDAVYHLGRFNREAGVSTAKFMARMGIK